MSDSSDYLTCQICGNYEICLITDPPGLESGLFCCSNGHTFCKNCFPNFIKEVTEKVYEPNFIRKELRFLIDNNKGLKYSNQEAIKNWEEWINYKDRGSISIILRW